MVGFYFFSKDLILPKRIISLFWSFLSLFGSVLPGGSVKWIFSANFPFRANPILDKEITQRSGFQGKFENKFSSYEDKTIPECWNTGIFERDFTTSKCSFSMGNCLFLFPFPLLAVRGLFLLSSGCTGSREFCHLYRSDLIIKSIGYI